MDLLMRFVGPGAVIASPFIGSFICCLIDRLPRGEDFGLSRSRCDSCRTIVFARDLVPILSYVALGGKCRKCEARIPIRLLGAELGIVVLTGCAVWFSEPHQNLCAVGFAWLLFALAQYDVVHGRLPDALTASVGTLGLAWSIIYRFPVSGTAAFAGALSGTLIPFAIAKSYRLATHRDGLGGGDIKLFGASGAWIGWQALPALLLIASLSALIVILMNKRLSRVTQIPFGPFIVFATFTIWCWQMAC